MATKINNVQVNVGAGGSVTYGISSYGFVITNTNILPIGVTIIITFPP